MLGCLEDSVTAETPKLSVYSYCVAEMFPWIGLLLCCQVNPNVCVFRNMQSFDLVCGCALGFGSVRSIETTVSDLWVYFFRVCRFCTCPTLLGLRISRMEKPTCSPCVWESFRKLFSVQGSLTGKQVVEILVELRNELIFHCCLVLQVHVQKYSEMLEYRTLFMKGLLYAMKNFVNLCLRTVLRKLITS